MLESKGSVCIFRVLTVVIWLSMYLAGSLAVAQEATKFTMQPVQELPITVKPQIINGRPASGKDWQATFIFRNADGAGCTATAIGQRVLLVAAHCIEDGATGTAAVGNVSATVRCNRHPSYPADISADFSLCVTSSAIPAPDDGFEHLNTTDLATPKLRQQVKLLGYGCRTVGGGDASFGSLYEGDAEVVQRVNNSLYVMTSGGAAVCFGDSGGGAYVAINANGTIRRLWGINSRGDISTNSWIATTANPVFVNWANDWVAKNSVEICGLSPSAQDCRQ